MSEGLTQAQAVKLAKSGFWKSMSPVEIVKFQLFEERLCMPFDIFHKAIEQVLDRPVFTHEFASVENLRKELLGDKPHPTFDEILALIPEDKRVVVAR